MSLGRAFFKAVKTYLCPTSLRGLAAAILAQQALHLGAGLILYPSPRDYLLAEGFNEKAVAAVTPRIPAFVRPVPQDRGTLDKIYALTDAPTLLGIAASLYYNAHSFPGYTVALAGCDIWVPKKESYDLRKEIADTLHVRREAIRPLPVNDKDAWLYTLTHETGHCHPVRETLATISRLSSALPENLRNAAGYGPYDTPGRSYDSELHSDMGALTFMNESTESVGIERMVLYYRAVSPLNIWSTEFGYAHDLALHIDASLSGKPPPTMKDVVDSRKELVGYIARYLESIKTKPLQVARKIAPDLTPPKTEDDSIGRLSFLAVQGTLRKYGDDMSPFARRRAELYIQGIEYFAPSLTESYIPSPAQTAPDLKKDEPAGPGVI